MPLFQASNRPAGPLWAIPIWTEPQKAFCLDYTGMSTSVSHYKGSFLGS